MEMNSSWKILVLKNFLKPGYLLLTLWLIMLPVFYMQPIEYHQEIGFQVWAYIFSGIGLFILGEKYASCAFFTNSKTVCVSVSRLNLTVLVTALLGIAGIILLSYDKLFLSGLDYTKGLAYIREIRGIQLASKIDLPRSFWLYLGYPFFSFSYPAIMLLVINARQIRPSIARVAQLSLLSPVGYALLYGGRMPVLILFLLLVSCCLIRRLQGKTFFPREHALLVKIILLGLCLAVYSNHVLSQRRDASNMMIYKNFLTNARISWGVEPKPWLDEAMDNDLVSFNMGMNLITNSMYITNGIVSLSKIIENDRTFIPYWGTYQVGILSPILRIFSTDANLADLMEAHLKAASIFGFYTTAWGAIFLDFGLIGAVFFILSWGLISGLAARSLKQTSDTAGHLILAFCLTSIVMSIFNGPFGMANSFLIFISLIGTVILLKEWDFKFLKNRLMVGFPHA